MRLSSLQPRLREDRGDAMNARSEEAMPTRGRLPRAAARRPVRCRSARHGRTGVAGPHPAATGPGAGGCRAHRRTGPDGAVRLRVPGGCGRTAHGRHRPQGKQLCGDRTAPVRRSAESERRRWCCSARCSGRVCARVSGSPLTVLRTRAVGPLSLPVSSPRDRRSRAMTLEASPALADVWSPPCAMLSVRQQSRCSSSRATAQDRSAALVAETWMRTSMRYVSCPTVRGSPRTCPSMRRGRLTMSPRPVRNRPPSAPQPVAALKPRRRRELPTTKTEEKAMAAPAIIGLRRPEAARGRAATL